MMSKIKGSGVRLPEFKSMLHHQGYICNLGQITQLVVPENGELIVSIS